MRLPIIVVQAMAARPARLRPALGPATMLVLAIVAAIACALSSWGAAIDELARVGRDDIRQTAASQHIVIVEIDAKSLRQIARWPWPRRHHAALVDRLRAAGAASVAFDVDFSSETNPADDIAFAGALDRFGGSVILATFGQADALGSATTVDNLPLPMLREHAFLGSVNVLPDPDGQLRNYSYGTVTGGVVRPAIAALIAGKAGQIGEDFRIDGAIAPASIPRLSYADILNGVVPAARLRGKSIVVGATAIEMGDRYVLPGHGVLPGVVIQALAAETLLQGHDFPNYGAWPMLLLAVLCIIGWRGTRILGFGTAVAIVVIGLLPLTLEAAGAGTLDIAPALTFVIVHGALQGLSRLLRNLRDARHLDGATGLPNERALIAGQRRAPHLTIVAVRLQQFGEMSVLLSDEENRVLVNRVIDRLRLAFPDAPVHVIGTGVFALAAGEVVMAELAERIEGACAVFRAPIDLASRRLVVTPNFGVSIGRGTDAGQLTAQAGLAARQAYEAGQRWALHNDQLSSSADRALVLLADLDSALASGDIHVVYQPKWSIATAHVSGAEALVRWTHRVLGPVGPDYFIPLLEENRRIADLTLHVVDASLKQAAHWRTIAPDFNVAVNVSAVLLDDADFVDALAARLKVCGPGVLTFEVTESATIGNAESSIATLARLQAAGARISIDDYGTGQSTLSYLKRFPADEIKIDKSFITDMANNVGDQILVRSTIALAHELALKVVAEGVENAECLARLTDYGCDLAQGWHIGKPMAPDLLTAQLIPPKLTRSGKSS